MISISGVVTGLLVLKSEIKDQTESVGACRF